MNMRFGDKVEEVAKQRRMTLKEVAEKAGIPYPTLRTYTKGVSDNAPPGMKAITLAKVLNVDTQWLYDDSRDLPAPSFFESPPFDIYPWPPDGITWEELQVAVATYAYQQCLDRLGGVWVGGQKKRDIPAHKFMDMADDPQYVVHLLKNLEAAAEKRKKMREQKPPHEE